MLRNKRILITESVASRLGTADRVRRLGGIPVAFPLIAIRGPADLRPLDKALETLYRFDWVLFTSSNGVRFFFRRALELNVIPELLEAVSYGAVGPGTAAAISESGREVAFVPTTFTGRALGIELPFRLGARFLIPRGDIAGSELSSALRSRAARVDVVEVYRTMRIAPGPETLRELNQGVDAILFSSGSAVASFVAGVPGAGSLVQRVPIGCIGPTTAEAAGRFGFPVAFTAEGTSESLCAVLDEYFQTAEKGEPVQ